jgi:hypothetical protein
LHGALERGFFCQGVDQVGEHGVEEGLVFEG